MFHGPGHVLVRHARLHVPCKWLTQRPDSPLTPCSTRGHRLLLVRAKLGARLGPEIPPAWRLPGLSANSQSNRVWGHIQCIVLTLGKSTWGVHPGQGLRLLHLGTAVASRGLTRRKPLRKSECWMYKQQSREACQCLSAERTYDTRSIPSTYQLGLTAGHRCLLSHVRSRSADQERDRAGQLGASAG